LYFKKRTKKVYPRLDTTTAIPTSTSNAANNNPTISLNETAINTKKETEQFLIKFNEFLASFSKLDENDEKTKIEIIDKIIKLFSSVDLDKTKSTFMNGNERQKLFNLSITILKIIDNNFPFEFFERILEVLEKENTKKITKLINEKFEKLKTNSNIETILSFHSLIFFAKNSIESTEFYKISDAIDLHINNLEKLETIEELEKIMEIHAKIFHSLKLSSTTKNCKEIINKVLYFQRKILGLKHNYREKKLLKLVIDQQKSILDFANNLKESSKPIQMNKDSKCGCLPSFSITSIEHKNRLIPKNESLEKSQMENDAELILNDVIEHQIEIIDQLNSTIATISEEENKKIKKLKDNHYELIVLFPNLIKNNPKIIDYIFIYLKDLNLKNFKNELFLFNFLKSSLEILNKENAKEIAKMLHEQFQKLKDKKLNFETKYIENIFDFHALIFSDLMTDTNIITEAIDLQINILKNITTISENETKLIEIIENIMAIHIQFFDAKKIINIVRHIDIAKKVIEFQKIILNYANDNELFKLIINQQKNILDFTTNSQELFDQILNDSEIQEIQTFKNYLMEHQNEIKKITQEKLRNLEFTFDEMIDFHSLIFCNFLDKDLITEVIDLQIKAIQNVNELKDIESILASHVDIYNSLNLKDLKNIKNFNFNNLNMVIEKVIDFQKNVCNLNNFDEKDLLKLVTNQQEDIFKFNEKMIEFSKDFPENADLHSILNYLVGHHTEIFNKVTMLITTLQNMTTEENFVKEIIDIILEYHQLILSFPKLIKNNKELLKTIFEHWKDLKNLNLHDISKEINGEVIKLTLEMSDQILNDFESFLGEELSGIIDEQKSDLILEINNYTNNIGGELLENRDEITQVLKSILNVLIGLKDVKSVGDFIKRIYEIIRHNRYFRIFFLKILKILLDLALFLLAYFANLSACFKNIDWFGYFYYTFLYFILLVCLILSLNDFFIFYNTEFDNEVAKHYIESFKTRTNFKIDRSKTYIDILKSLVFLPNEILYSISYIINKYSNVFEFCVWNFKNQNYKCANYFTFAISLILILFSFTTVSFSFYLILTNCNQINICSIFVLILLLCKMICEIFKFFYFKNFKIVVNENKTNFIRHIRHEEHLTAGCVLKENCNSFDLEHIVYCHFQLNSKPQISHLDLKKVFCNSSYKNYMVGFYLLNENGSNFVIQKHQIEGIKIEKNRSNEIEAIRFSRFFQYFFRILYNKI
jgi:hypothetical protein